MLLRNHDIRLTVFHNDGVIEAGPFMSSTGGYATAKRKLTPLKLIAYQDPALLDELWALMDAVGANARVDMHLGARRGSKTKHTVIQYEGKLMSVVPAQLDANAPKFELATYAVVLDNLYAPKSVRLNNGQMLMLNGEPSDQAFTIAELDLKSQPTSMNDHLRKVMDR